MSVPVKERKIGPITATVVSQFILAHPTERQAGWLIKRLYRSIGLNHCDYSYDREAVLALIRTIRDELFGIYVFFDKDGKLARFQPRQGIQAAQRVIDNAPPERGLTPFLLVSANSKEPIQVRLMRRFPNQPQLVEKLLYHAHISVDATPPMQLSTSSPRAMRRAARNARRSSYWLAA